MAYRLGMATLAGLTAMTLACEEGLLLGFVVLAIAMLCHRWERITLEYMAMLLALYAYQVSSSQVSVTIIFLFLAYESSMLRGVLSHSVGILSLVLLYGIALGVSAMLFDRNMFSLFLVLMFATWPGVIIRWRGHHFSRALHASLAGVIAFGIVALICLERVSSEKVAILEHGVWGSAKPRLSWSDPVNQASLYSYSEMARLIGASIIEDTNALSEFDELWIITPTKPFSKQEKSQIHSWVWQGGHLILLTDHTDLYGHSRVVNDLLVGFAVSVSNTAFFPQDPRERSRVAFGKDSLLKTTNVVQGIGLLSTVSANWFEESPDYSGRNFFGLLRPSVDDSRGFKCILGERQLGLGYISVFSDSTMFANFSMYDPDSINLLEKVRARSGGAIIFVLSPFVLMILTAGYDLFRLRSRIATTALCIAGLAFQPLGTELQWDAPVVWSGNRMYLSEHIDPGESISTLFALFSISGRQPKWIDSYDGQDGHVWIAQEPPPTKGWKWLRPTSSDWAREEGTGPILEAINPKAPIAVPVEITTDWLPYVDLWSNSALGDWWVDSGISTSKEHRVKSFVNWALEQNYVLPPISVPPESRLLAELIIGGSTVAAGEVPDVFMKEGEVYLGRGVTGYVVNRDGGNVVVGVPPLVEGWRTPPSWVVRPLRRPSPLFLKRPSD